MSKAIELAEHYENKAKKFQPTGDARFRLNELTAELRRLAAVEQELSACKSRCNAAVGQADALRQELADLKAAMGEPVDQSKLDDMAWSEFELAMSGGVSVDSFKRLANSVAKLYAKAKP